MGITKTTIKIPKVTEFEEMELNFPIYINDHCTHYKLLSTESYIKVDCYDDAFRIELIDIFDEDSSVDIIRKYIAQGDYHEATPDEFKAAYDRAIKFINTKI